MQTTEKTPRFRATRCIPGCVAWLKAAEACTSFSMLDLQGSVHANPATRHDIFVLITRCGSGVGRDAGTELGDASMSARLWTAPVLWRFRWRKVRNHDPVRTSSNFPLLQPGLTRRR